MQSHELPFAFILTDTDATGSVAFTHNTVTLQNSTAIDANTPGIFSGVLDYTSDASQTLTFSAFSNNAISIENRTVDSSDTASLYQEGFGTTLFTQGFSNNVITAASNDGGGFGWEMDDDTTISGNVSDNAFTVSGNTTDDIGLCINNLFGGEVVTFEQAVSGNSFLINGSLTGNDGIQLDATGGTINFDGNSSQIELSSTNNNVSINAVGGTINYNG